jgi:HlyD family secretion protein
LWWRSGNGSSISFTTALLKHGDVVATITATGTIEPLEVVDVGAQVAGRIQAFGNDIAGKQVDYRSVVAEGALLAKIDESVYSADLAVAKAQLDQEKAGELSAQASLDQAKARFIQSESDWRRAVALDSQKLSSTADFETAKVNHEVARANVSAADAALAQAKASVVQAVAAVDKAQRNVGFCTIVSPVNGIIIDRRVNIGQTVVASLNAPSLFLIARDLTKMQIWVAVNEADVGRITPGEPVTFTCDAFAGKQFDGTVGKVRLNATMTQNVVMYTVEVNTMNRDNVLLPYLTANVKFVLSSQSNVLLAPNAALRWTPATLAEVAPDVRPSLMANVAAGSDSLVDPPPPNRNKSPGESQGTLWLKEGAYVRPLTVTIGTSDGIYTAIIGTDLRDGQEVVTGEIATSAKQDATNPFLPKMIRR